MQMTTLEMARAIHFMEIQRAKTSEILKRAYEEAVALGDVELATQTAKDYRDALHLESDKYVVDGNPKAALWRPYKEALRGIDKQEGFPLQIVFPEKPE